MTFDDAIPWVVGGVLVAIVIAFTVANRAKAKSKTGAGSRGPARPPQKPMRNELSLDVVLIAFGLLLAGIGVVFHKDLADVGPEDGGGRVGQALFRFIGTYLGPTGVLVFMLLFGGAFVAYGVYQVRAWWRERAESLQQDDPPDGGQDG
jgi:hypothetical protein